MCDPVLLLVSVYACVVYMLILSVCVCVCVCVCARARAACVHISRVRLKVTDRLGDALTLTQRNTKAL